MSSGQEKNDKYNKSQHFRSFCVKDFKKRHFIPVNAVVWSDMSAAVAWGSSQQGPSSLRPVQLCNSQSNRVFGKLLAGKNGWKRRGERRTNKIIIIKATVFCFSNMEIPDILLCDNSLPELLFASYNSSCVAILPKKSTIHCDLLNMRLSVILSVINALLLRCNASFSREAAVVLSPSLDFFFQTLIRGGAPDASHPSHDT